MRILFDVATIDINDISAQNKLVADGEDDSDDIDRHVDDWIADNQWLYNSWLRAARSATQSGLAFCRRLREWGLSASPQFVGLPRILHTYQFSAMSHM